MGLADKHQLLIIVSSSRDEKKKIRMTVTKATDGLLFGEDCSADLREILRETINFFESF